MILSCDIETYSSVDLKKSGVYAYTASPDFEILMVAYEMNGGEVKIIDIKQGEALPFEFETALYDPNVTKTAYNANFERVCMNKHFMMDLPVGQWRCTAVLGNMAGLPGYLAGVAKALGVSEQKSSAGSALIRYFCCPCKPTKANGQRVRNLPHHDPEKWEMFKEYCMQDVRTEREVRSELLKLGVTDDYEVGLYALDQKINDRGVLVDRWLIDKSISMDTAYQEECESEMTRLTGFDNASLPKIKKLLGIEGSLDKATVEGILAGDNVDELTRSVLELRQKMGKTSNAKYEAALRSASEGWRVRGMFQFYGASTGRWAGRILQPQNLPKNYLPDLDDAREMVLEGDAEGIEMLYGSVPNTLSELIRTMFIAPKGKELVVADFSAIEARVISWLAGETWRMDVFAGDGKIYEASASAMFGVPIETIAKGGVNYELRAKGKVAELACGYQGGVNALERMGGESMGLSEKEMREIVESWREANPNIVQLWKDVQKAVMKAIPCGYDYVGNYIKVHYYREKRLLSIELPSGRKLRYYNTRLEMGDKGPQIAYDSYDSVTKQWHKTFTYGGKLVENLCQSIARDCLAVTMLELDKRGFEIVMHIHDEVVCEVPEGLGAGALVEMCQVMAEKIDWAPGLVLCGDGFVGRHYKKEG